MIEVVNAKDNMPAIHTGEYVGRGNSRGRWRKSPLANTFKIGVDGDRDYVIAMYQRWLRNKVLHGDRAVLDELARLASIVERTGHLTLVCWCAPLPCHADVIKLAIEKVLPKEEYV